MMYYVYILQSQKTSRFYIGQTNDVVSRLDRHNSFRVKSTKHGAPWVIVLSESYASRSEAMSRETEIKFKKKINNITPDDGGEVA